MTTLGDAPSTARPLSGAPGSMTLVEHLAELRRRLLVSIAAVAVATVVAWLLYDRAVAFMVGPYHAFLARHPHDDASHGSLVVTGPLEGFTTRVQVSLALGAVLSAPVLLWQLWAFVTPGLLRHERRYAASFLGSTLVLFALGVGTAVLVFPKAIAWMIGVSGSQVVPLFSPSKYFRLYALLCVVFGASFTYPVVLVFLEIIGVVTSTKLRKWRRHAIVALVVVAAVITPSNDPFSFLAMALPLVVLYELSILAGRLLHK